MTVAEALRYGAERLRGVTDSPRHEARLLLAHALGVTQADLLRDSAAPVETAAYEGLLARRAAHEPIALILGHTGFWTLDLEVSPATLIPRADSETVVRAVLTHRPPLPPMSPPSLTSWPGSAIARPPVMVGEGRPSTPCGADPDKGVDGRAKPGHDGGTRTTPGHDGDARAKPGHDGGTGTTPGHDGGDHPRILDLGTGTGCLLLALLSEYPNAFGIGIDIAPEAAALARRNAARNGLAGRSAFAAANWTDSLSGRFDVIVSNPPYISASTIPTLMVDVVRYEPVRALDGGADGYDAYRAIIPRLHKLLAPRGLAAFEIGIGQAATVSDLVQTHGFKSSVHCDLAGIERVVALECFD